METSAIGISRDLIIHPGETLGEMLDDRGVTQLELAKRTGVSPTHISYIIAGKRDISAAFAQKLEYALGVSARFWLNLQANYDAELQEYSEANNVSSEEISALLPLRPIMGYLRQLSLVDAFSSNVEAVIEMRRFFRCSSLTAVPDVAITGAFRLSRATEVDLNIMYAWLTLCDRLGELSPVDFGVDIEKLKTMIPTFKTLMFLPADQMVEQLEKQLEACGIRLRVVKHFRGAPVHGFIQQKENGSLLMFLTIRGAYADRFWFSFFHELGHVFNGDVSKQLIGYNSKTGNEAIETAADCFARDTLLDSGSYDRFIARGDFSINTITRYAETQNVPSYIVIGRLQKEKLIGYNMYSNYLPRFKWTE